VSAGRPREPPSVRPDVWAVDTWKLSAATARILRREWTIAGLPGRLRSRRRSVRTARDVRSRWATRPRWNRSPVVEFRAWLHHPRTRGDLRRVRRPGAAGAVATRRECFCRTGRYA